MKSYHLYFTLPDGTRLWLTALNGFSAGASYENAKVFKTESLDSLKQYCFGSLRQVFQVGQAPILQSKPWKGVDINKVTIQHEEVPHEARDAIEFPRKRKVWAEAS